MYSGNQLQNLIRDLVSIPHVVDKADPVCVQKIMSAYHSQQPEAYVMADQAGTIQELGEGVEKLTSYCRHDLLGLYLHDVFITRHVAMGRQAGGASLLLSQQIDFYRRSGKKTAAILHMRKLEEAGRQCGYEGLFRLSDACRLSGDMNSGHPPLLSLSLSGGILSANAGGCNLLSEWRCQLGATVPEWMQDQVLDTWCAGFPLSFGKHVYIPLMAENIILFSSVPSNAYQPGTLINDPQLQYVRMPVPA